jgi:hypothetical protein
MLEIRSIAPVAALIVNPGADEYVPPSAKPGAWKGTCIESVLQTGVLYANIVTGGSSGSSVTVVVPVPAGPHDVPAIVYVIVCNPGVLDDRLITPVDGFTDKPPDDVYTPPVVKPVTPAGAGFIPAIHTGVVG